MNPHSMSAGFRTDALSGHANGAGTGVVLVTGGSCGIGASCVRMAAARGWAVGINYRSDGDAARTRVAEAEALGVRAVAVQADVADEAQVIRLFDECAAALGPITAVVNNAGIVSPAARVEDYSVERLRRLVDVNVIGAFIVARETVRHLSVRRGGRGGVLVNISSVAARLGGANQYVDYAASKGAIDTMTIGLAQETLADEIRVVGIRPGLVDTDIHASGGIPDRVQKLSPGLPMKRAATPDEIAAAVMWFLEPGASYANGCILDVTGAR